MRDRGSLARALYVGVLYIPAIASFAGFLWWNEGSVVLGDRTNHQFSLHFAQLGYFFAFATFFAWPQMLLDPRHIPTLLRRVRQSKLGAAFGIAALLACSLIAVRHFTYEHPFLLADNRHYTFYVWRRVVNAQPWTRSAFSIVYAGAATLWLSSLGTWRCCAGTHRSATPLILVDRGLLLRHGTGARANAAHRAALHGGTVLRDAARHCRLSKGHRYARSAGRARLECRRQRSDAERLSVQALPLAGIGRGATLHVVTGYGCAYNSQNCRLEHHYAYSRSCALMRSTTRVSSRY